MQKTHHSPAKLVEEAKRWDGLGDLEGRVATLPFANTVLCYVYTLYGWERHFFRLQTLEGIANSEVRR